MVANQHNTSRSLVAGFMLVLILMTITGLTDLYYLHRHNLSMEHIVTVHNEKTYLLQRMQDAMRERQIGIRDMLIETNDFERDKAWQRHNQAATRFLEARVALELLNITPDEELAFEQLREAVAEGSFVQKNLVEAILSNQSKETLRPVINNALQAQQLAVEQLQILQNIQLEAANLALADARSSFHFITLFTLIISTVSLAAGGLIAIVVIRRFKQNAQLLHNQHVLLENTVDQRTADLRSAVHELEALSYSLAHDLRTPLRAVTSFSQILLQESSSHFNNEERQQLKRIASAGKYMALLLDDMRTLSRLSRCHLEIQNIDLSTLADDTLYELRATHTSNKIEVHIEKGLLAHADATLMRLVFSNLFGNSLKFAAPGRTLKLALKCSMKNQPIYCISDNGSGFDAVYAEKIFKPFERLHKVEDGSGTGIGLAIVERIIKRHGGNIRAESQLHKGTQIFFTLGRHKTVAAAQA